MDVVSAPVKTKVPAFTGTILPTGNSQSAESFNEFSPLLQVVK